MSSNLILNYMQQEKHEITGLRVFPRGESSCIVMKLMERIKIFY